MASANGITSTLPMASITGKKLGFIGRSTSTSTRLSKSFLVTAVERNKEASQETEYVNRPARVSWSSDFWERSNKRGAQWPEETTPQPRRENAPPPPRPVDTRFSRAPNEAGRATRILASLKCEIPKNESVEVDRIEKRQDGKAMQDVASHRSNIQRVPSHPRTIYGHPIENWKVAVLNHKDKREAYRAKREFEMEESTYLNEEWKRKRIHWICTEIPRLDAARTVKILNSQVKWLRNKDISIVCNRLLNIDHFNRAHRVFKWSTQRPWYVLDFQLTSRMCENLAETGRVGRARDIFDVIIKSAYVPKESTFCALIKAYLQDGAVKYVEEAWKVYKKMIEFANYEPPPVVKNSIFKCLTESGKSSLRWVERSNEVFNSIRNSRLPCTTEMYESLITLHALKGDEQRVQFLVDDMTSQSVELSPLIFGAIIRVCSKTGNYVKAEQVFQQLKESSVEEPDWHYYIALMEAYGKAGLHDKAMELFREAESSSTFPKFQLFKTILVIMGDADQVEVTEEILSKLNPSMHMFQTLQSAFNSVMRMYSRGSMFEKVEEVLSRMKDDGCRPNIDSYNIQLQAFADNGEMVKAEELYNKMLNKDCLKANYKSHSIMLGAYGRANMKKKVREVFKLLTEHKQPVPEEFETYVNATVAESLVEKAKSYAKPKLTTMQRSIIAGILLAGAKMTPVSSTKASVCFEQNAGTFRGQVLMKKLYDVFSDWAVEPPKVFNEVNEVNEEENGGQPNTEMLRFETSVDVKFFFYYHQYRDGGRSRVPRLVHRWLTDMALAFWYMYGGHLSPDKRSIILNAAPYSYNELCLVVEAMHGRKIQCDILRDAKDKCFLKFTGETAVWLWRLMEEYVPEELFPLFKPGGEDFGDPVQLKICSS